MHALKKIRSNVKMRFGNRLREEGNQGMLHWKYNVSAAFSAAFSPSPAIEKIESGGGRRGGGKGGGQGKQTQF